MLWYTNIAGWNIPIFLRIENLITMDGENNGKFLLKWMIWGGLTV